MSRMFRQLVLGGAALVCAQSVCASDGAVSLDPAKSRTVSVNFVTCVVSKKRLKPIAVRFLLQGRSRDGQMLASDRCFLTSLLASGFVRAEADALSGRWKVRAFRYLIANGLLMTEFKESGPADFSSVPSLPELEVNPREFSSTEEVEAANIFVRLGECAARRDPEGIRRMAQTDVNSREELVALRALASTFGSCMETGVTLRLNREIMRDSSVLGYARLAYSLQSSAGASLDAGAKN